MNKQLPIALAIVSAIAVGVWLLLSPALMTEDSCDQLRQAVLHTYHDMHTPLMSIVLTFFVHFGGGLVDLTFVQCLAGCIGIFLLLSETIEFLCPGTWSESGRNRLALLGLVMLLTPPLAEVFWLMTFLKDAWCMIFMIDLGGCAFYLYRRGPTLHRVEFCVLAALFMTLTELVLLSRYNAIVALPAIGWCLWQVLRSRPVSRLVSAALCLALLPIHLGVSEGLYRCFSVARLHPENQILALDLVGLCSLDQQLLDEFPYTRSQVKKGYRKSYIFGDLVPMVWEGKRPTIVNPEMVFTKMGRRRDPQRDVLLHEEWRRAVCHHPLLLLQVKWRSFLPLLSEFKWHHPTGHDVPAQPLDSRTAEARDFLFTADDFLQLHLWPHALFTSHWPWLLVNLLAVLATGVAASRSHQARLRFLLAWLLVPLSYYFSYFFASVAREYRFMYPATAVVQTLTVACLLAFLCRSLKWRTVTVTMALFSIRRLRLRPISGSFHDV